MFLVFFCFLWFSPCFSNWPLGGKKKASGPNECSEGNIEN